MATQHFSELSKDLVSEAVMRNWALHTVNSTVHRTHVHLYTWRREGKDKPMSPDTALRI